MKMEVTVFFFGFFALFPPQMANLVHRAHQLLQKQYLIIHPTADGKKALFTHFNAYLTGKYGILCISSIFFPAEKVHFQHTAKFINHLISEKANYTLQVRLQSIFKETEFDFLHIFLGISVTQSLMAEHKIFFKFVKTF